MTQTTTEKDTKSALLDCAEKLFFEKGFEAVSVREITDAAGANVAAVNYHFSSKTQLYRACLQRRLAEMARRRITTIERAVAQQSPPTLQGILAAYVRDSFKSMLVDPDDSRLLQIIFREMNSAGVASDLVTRELVLPIHKTMISAIQQACPELPEKFISRCVSSVAGQILHFIRLRDTINSIVRTDSEAEYIEEITQHITDFSLRGIGSHHHV